MARAASRSSESATDPSGVDTIAFPDLSGTTGFSGTGGTSTNGSSVDPFVATASYGFTSAATTAPGANERRLPPTSAATSATTR